MGESEKKIEDLLGRIDELIRILKFLSNDLSEISRSLKASLGAYTSTQEASPSESLKPPVSAQQTIALEEPSPQSVSSESITIDSVQSLFPPDLASLLYFEDMDNYILVKPRQYLGSDNFRRIASIVRDQLGGEYISAGRDSHFRIPKA